MFTPRTQEFCAWCDDPLPLTKGGNRPKTHGAKRKFCSVNCRIYHWRWAKKILDARARAKRRNDEGNNEGTTS